MQIDFQTEALSPSFFDETAIRRPLYQLHRLNDGHTRLYYTYDFGHDLQFFPGMTGMLSKVLPTPEGLIRWRAAKGLEEADRYAEERAAFGSLMHEVFGVFLLEKAINLDVITDRIESYFLEHQIHYNAYVWSKELRKDLLAFAKWVHDAQVTPLAIEVPLCSQEFSVASCVDLICEVTVEEKGYWGDVYKSGKHKGEPKETKQRVRKKAIVDFKSAQNANSYEEHELQLAGYELLVKENFPEWKDDEFLLLNWHPKDWRTAPDYHLVNQTGKHPRREFELLVELYHLKFQEAAATKLYTSGTIDFEHDLTLAYTTASYAEMLQEEGAA